MPTTTTIRTPKKPKMRASGVSAPVAVCMSPPACRPMPVAAMHATYSDSNPMIRRSTPVK